MNSSLRQQAIDLRIENECSYSEIKKRLGVSKSTLSYWLKELPLNEKRISELRRLGWQKGEASREKFRNTMRKKREFEFQKIYKQQQKRLFNISRETLFVAGLMLYLGEGDKKNHTRIVLANTDPDIIKFFIKWMVDFLDVARENIKAQLHLYENMGIDEEKKFWKMELGFQDSQFYKSQIRTLQKNSFSYKESYRHGTCSIYVLSVIKKRELTAAIQVFLDRYIRNIK